MKKVTLLVGSIVLAASSSSFTVFAAKGPNPFSDCGIGAALFQDTKWAAVTSNVIWDVGTTAVTSATASPETCNGQNIAAAKFIIDNYDNLAENLAEGKGEHLSAMYKVLELNTDAQEQATSYIRHTMAENIADSKYQTLSLSEKANKLYEAVTESVAKAS